MSIAGFAAVQSESTSYAAGTDGANLRQRYARQVCLAALPSRVSFRPPGYEAATIFSLVPDSGTSAAAFRPSWTLGTVALTSVIGRPCVGAIVFTPSRSIR